MELRLLHQFPGEMQIKGKAGSVLIQDSRLWHSSALHNFSNYDRVAVVSRWCHGGYQLMTMRQEVDIMLFVDHFPIQSF